MFRPEWPPEELPAFARGAEQRRLRRAVAGRGLLPDRRSDDGGGGARRRRDAITVGIGLLPGGDAQPRDRRDGDRRARAAAPRPLRGRVRPRRRAVDAADRRAPARTGWRRSRRRSPPSARCWPARRVTVHGRHVHLDDVKLAHRPYEPPPILIGTTGPRALAAAGRSADGILLPEGSVPAAVRWAREAGGRPRPTVVYAWLSLDDDRSAAAAALRPGARGLAEDGPVPERCASRPASTTESAAELEDDRMRALAVAGDARDCARAIAELWARGRRQRRARAAPRGPRRHSSPASPPRSGRCCEPPARARLGLTIGTLPSGPLDAITDVDGIRVGSVTLIEGRAHVAHRRHRRRAARRPRAAVRRLRTGSTATAS